MTVILGRRFIIKTTRHTKQTVAQLQVNFE